MLPLLPPEQHFQTLKTINFPSEPPQWSLPAPPSSSDNKTSSQPLRQNHSLTQSKTPPFPLAAPETREQPPEQPLSPLFHEPAFLVQHTRAREKLTAAQSR